MPRLLELMRGFASRGKHVLSLRSDPYIAYLNFMYVHVKHKVCRISPSFHRARGSGKKNNPQNSNEQQKPKGWFSLFSLEVMFSLTVMLIFLLTLPGTGRGKC